MNTLTDTYPNAFYQLHGLFTSLSRLYGRNQTDANSKITTELFWKNENEKALHCKTTVLISSIISIPSPKCNDTFIPAKLRNKSQSILDNE